MNTNRRVAKRRGHDLQTGIDYLSCQTATAGDKNAPQFYGAFEY
jgi:hypothetical protein